MPRQGFVPKLKGRDVLWRHYVASKSRGRYYTVTLLHYPGDRKVTLWAYTEGEEKRITVTFKFK